MTAKLSNRLNATGLSFLTSPDPSRKWKELSSRPRLHVLPFQHHISTSQTKTFFGGISYISCMGVCELSVPPKRLCVLRSTKVHGSKSSQPHTPNANLRNSKEVVISGNWNVYKVHHGKAFASLVSWGICAINLDPRNYLKPELAPRKKMRDNIATRSQKGYNDFADFAMHRKQCIANALLCDMN